MMLLLMLHADMVRSWSLSAHVCCCCCCGGPHCQLAASQSYNRSCASCRCQHPPWCPSASTHPPHRHSPTATTAPPRLPHCRLQPPMAITPHPIWRMCTHRAPDPDTLPTPMQSPPQHHLHMHSPLPNQLEGRIMAALTPAGLIMAALTRASLIMAAQVQVSCLPPALPKVLMPRL